MVHTLLVSGIRGELLMNGLDVRYRVQAAFERAGPPEDTEGPDRACALMAMHHTAKLVAGEIAEILADCSTRDDYLEVMRGLASFSRG